MRSLCSATGEAPAVRSLCSATGEAPAVRGLCSATSSSLCSLQLEKSPHSSKDPSRPRDINKIVFLKTPLHELPRATITKGHKLGGFKKKTTEMHPLAVLEARNLKSRFWQGCALSEVSRRKSVICIFLSPYVAGDPWSSLTCRHKPLIFACHYTMLSLYIYYIYIYTYTYIYTHTYTYTYMSRVSLLLCLQRHQSH